MQFLINYLLTLTPEQETFNFIVVLLGIVLLIIILAYILLTSKQD